MANNLYGDITKIAQTQQLPNARFRGEFIRKNMSNPGAFYQKFGSQINNPLGGTQSFNQPMQSLQTIGDSKLGSMYSNSGAGLGPNGSGGTYSAGMGNGTPTGTGGILSNSPALGGVIGAGLSAVGVPFGGVLGQVASGTPESQANAVKGTAIGVGTSLLGPYGALAGLGINSAMTGKAPSMEALGMTAAYMNPATAPFAAAYGITKNLTALNNERLATNFREQQMYGLANPEVSHPFGPDTTFSGMFGNTDMSVKNEDGTGLTPGATMGFLGNLQSPTSLADPTNPGFGVRAADPMSFAQTLHDLYGGVSGMSFNSPQESFRASEIANENAINSSLMDTPFAGLGTNGNDNTGGYGTQGGYNSPSPGSRTSRDAPGASGEGGGDGSGGGKSGGTGEGSNGNAGNGRD